MYCGTEVDVQRALNPQMTVSILIVLVLCYPSRYETGAKTKELASAVKSQVAQMNVKTVREIRGDICSNCHRCHRPRWTSQS